MPETILTTTQIAERADYTREQIWAKARKGEIPALRANPGAKHYRYYDSPELQAWCEERAGRRARSLARKQASETYTLPNGETLVKPWSWTKAHERLLNRKKVGGDPFAPKKQPLLDAVAQDMWRKLAKKHHLSARELFESIRAGRVERIEFHAGKGFNRAGGILSWEGIAGAYRLLRNQIGEEWRDWTPQEREWFRALMLPLVEFYRAVTQQES